MQDASFKLSTKTKASVSVLTEAYTISCKSGALFDGCSSPTGGGQVGAEALTLPFRSAHSPCPS